MIEEVNIQGAAEQFIERFGNDAPREAAMRMEELQNTGDIDGYNLWQKIYDHVCRIIKK